MGRSLRRLALSVVLLGGLFVTNAQAETRAQVEGWLFLYGCCNQSGEPGIATCCQTFGGCYSGCKLTGQGDYCIYGAPVNCSGTVEP